MNRAAYYIFALCTFAWSSRTVGAQSNTACNGTTLDWYTSVVGETPCSTYQRLRQICDSACEFAQETEWGYPLNARFADTVGRLSTDTPGDHCIDQVSNCCCNSISFALSMLCISCQQGVGSGVNGDNGIDAGKGAYQLYLQKDGLGAVCGPGVNKSLPADVQSAVCNTKLKIDDGLYNIFWDQGDWFYKFTRDALTLGHTQFSNNTFTHCASTTINNSTSSISSGTTSIPTITTSVSAAPSKSSSLGLSGGAIAGTVIGAITILLLGGILVWFLRRRSRINADDDYNAIYPESDHAFIQPFDPPTMQSTSSLGLSSTGYPLVSLTDHSNSEPPRPRKGAVPPSSENIASTDSSHSHTSSSPLPERHLDAGEVMLERSPSGRLPPAYGEQTG